ncbi:TPA: hypothetical protein DIU27_01820 [Candidatus Collierbacteria bacterium]|uniref:Alpha/beta hydrolase family protein n=1 Tax=Candidatus Collierbacteria bacterium GW2011_GWB2_44_22 TaxID=1618387 RepID=A0A0G1HXJ9_9BACT|nr:MAG: Alpha/beta hydrolase family protein [Candidatus Collierbacteria bacterium GW2011_GWA2_44_13]KKT51861.1 MAG: Alpha/beta hydrolase family protein [Candidatus Collierbacteria bacterium GW2011_GWB2_44_22]KKT61963.1 MAG: Alpha/beta hydrolase family protein [Candidatus Collierbacteria bacterium GW2011_GWD1_44_27]KKT64986.1 MAG: Alpha/beta hydrolase family protein [Candidatus Collierbacteria bacterium GW2011_GWC2_44_30]KKT68187.1 MAG: alpha/beta hydrolase fold protein [Microgenomates group bac
MQTVVDGVLTNYEIFNPKQADTLVILHGWGSSLKFWIPIVKQISTDFQVILVDLPGFGSTNPIDTTPDIPEYTDFVRHFTQKLKLNKFILAGHSFGGQVALDYSIKYPENLASIILIAPVAVLEKPEVLKFKVKIAETIKPMLSNPSNRLAEQLLGWYTPDEYANSNEHQKKVLHKIVKYNLEPLMNQVKVPTDIIWGNLDIVVPNSGSILLKNIPNSRLHIISGANHLVHLTHTKQLAQIIDQIISQHYS